MPTTLERLAAILAKDYPIAPGQLTLDTPLEALGIDSLGAVEMLWHVEDAFQVQMPPEPVALATVGAVVRFIDDLVAAQRAGASHGLAGAAASQGT